MRDLIGRSLGSYRIVEKICEGGMGVVYWANDERLDRDAAIKVLPEEVAEDEAAVNTLENSYSAKTEMLLSELESERPSDLSDTRE